MKLRWDFSTLHAAMHALGAAEVPFALKRSTSIEAIEAQLIKGIEIRLEDLRSTAGLLTFEGRQVLLYIPDQAGNIAAVLAGEREKGKRFHIADCETLDKMRRQQRFERYIATTDVSGLFSVHGEDFYEGSKEGRAPLHVCINCLKLLNYKQARVSGWHGKVRDTFKLDEFFDTYASCFSQLPSRTIADAASSSYSADWATISEQVRADYNWTCNACLVNLSSHRNLLHVHHIDGVKSNNNRKNLKVLCAACHRMQPLHERMHVSLANMKTINALRVEQGIVARDWKSAMACADPALHGIIGILQRKSWEAPQLEHKLPGMTLALEVAWPERGYAITLSALSDSPPRGWTVHSVQEAWKRHA